MSARRSFFAAMTALLWGAGVLQAQSAMQRPGIALGIGLGLASLDGRCDACAAPGTAAVEREVTVTFIMTPRLQFGATIAGAVSPAKGYGEHEAAMLGTVRGYPIPGRPVHFDLSFGRGRYRVARQLTAVTQELRSSGTEWAVAAGWDFPAGLDLVASPQIGYRRSGASTLTLNGYPLASVKFSVLSVGVALRWRAIPFVPAPESGTR